MTKANTYIRCLSGTVFSFILVLQGISGVPAGGTMQRRTARRTAELPAGIHFDRHFTELTNTVSRFRDGAAGFSVPGLLPEFIPAKIAQIPHGSPDKSVSGSLQTFTVTTANDTGAGSLRKAIHDANANPGPDRITFDIGGGGIQRIQPKTDFEVITSPVIMDGTTQPGYSNHPLIELNGDSLVSQYQIGLEIDAPGVTIRGLAINGFGTGIAIDTSGGDTIVGNYIGTDPTGEISVINSNFGIGISGPHNRIGGIQPGEGNVIQGSWINIEVIGNDPGWFGFSHENVIQGNIIGLDAAGTTIILPTPPQANGGAISIFGSYHDSVGGPAPGARNIISGNLDGIYLGGYDHLMNTVPSYGSVIQGNYIGLDITGKNPLGNLRAGITLYRSYNNLVGGTSAPARNVIANNRQNGIRLLTPQTTGNIIQGNYIGTDSGGVVHQADTTGNGEGIYSFNTHDNTIGGSVAGSGNLICGNLDNGIWLDSLSENIVVQGNAIGVTTLNHTVTPAGNGFHGLVINAASRSRIGGLSNAEGNTISANAYHGILITGNGATGNVVTGNFIGTDSLTTPGLGNAADGILIDGSGNAVGGTSQGSGNTIWDNGGVGVYVLSGTGNLINQNSITDNRYLGIDLAPTGPNPDDSLDTDTGPNELQNYPVIDSVNRALFQTIVKGHLNSIPNNEFRIEFFENHSPDSLQYGEGETYLGFTTATTDGSGRAEFTYTGPITPDNSMITSTATDTGGNTSEFSKDLKAITITSPAGGELWITREPDTIRWKLSTDFDSVVIGYNTEPGQAFSLIVTSYAKSGEYVWFPPTGILSKKCRILAFDKDNSDINDTSAVFKIKGYVLTRDSAGQYVAFDPARHGWKFPNDSASIWPESWFSNFNYLTGTDPNTNILYPPLIWVTGRSWNFPSWPTFVQAFGIAQCYYSTLLPVYKPSAIARWIAIKGKWGGSCFGMGTSAAMAFEDSLLFTSHFSLGGGYGQPAGLDVNNDIRNVINQLMTQQFGKQYQQLKLNSLGLKPMDVLQELKSFLKDEASSPRTLRIGIPEGGHIVNPFKVETNPANTNEKWIFVYDNNWPGSQSNKIIVDSAANTWSYAGGLNWSGNNGMFLVDPASDYYTQPTLGTIPLAANRKTFNELLAAPGIDVYAGAGASVSILNSSKDSIGYFNGHPFNNMSNAAPIVPETGGLHAPVGYTLPGGDTYSVFMGHYSDTTARFSAFTDSTIFTYYRSGVQDTETDHLSVGSGFDVINSNAPAKRADIQSILLNGTHEKVVNLKNTSINPSGSLHVEILNRQNVRIVNSGDSLKYDVGLTYAAGDGEVDFSHAGCVVPSNGAVQIVPAWDSLAYAPAKILIDHANNGTYDDSVIINNQSAGWYLDTVGIGSRYLTGGKSVQLPLVLNAPAPHGGVRVSLSSNSPVIASVPASVFFASGVRQAGFIVTTQVVLQPDTVVVTASVNGIIRYDTIAVLPQGVEYLTLNPAGGVIGGDSVICGVWLSNSAPSGGTMVTLSAGNPALAQVPPNITIAEGAQVGYFKIYTVQPAFLDSVLITANSGARQTSVWLKISPFGSFRISPDTVVGGWNTTLTATIGVPAPQSGVQFRFQTSDSAIATVASPLVIPQGQMQNGITITTYGVAADTSIRVMVTNAPAPVSLPLLVRPAGLASISHVSYECLVGSRSDSRQKYTAGSTIQFYTTMNGKVPAPGVQVHVASDRPDVLPVDSILMIPSSLYSQAWTYWNATSRSDIASLTQVVVTLSYHGSTLKDTLLFLPHVRYKMVQFSGMPDVIAAVGVNNAGDVLLQGINGVYLWNNGRLTDLRTYPGFHLGSVLAINDSGDIAGEVYPNAAIWRNDTTIVFPNPPGIVEASATAINNYGDIVCEMTSGSQTDITGCIWKNGVRIPLDNYDSQHYLKLSAINDSGEVAGSAIPKPNPYNTVSSAAVLWKNGHIAWSIIGDATYYNSAYFPYGRALNDSGVFVGETYTTPGLTSQGWFFRRGSDTTDYPTLPPYYGTRPLHINSRGDVVGEVWADDYETSPMGFLYKDGYYYDVNCLVDSLLSNQAVAFVNCINDSGVMTGATRFGYYPPYTVSVFIPVKTLTSVKSTVERIPTVYSLSQNFPNPFNPSTTIRYDLPRESRVSLVVYNILGQAVATLVDATEAAGERQVVWDSGGFAAGVYFCRLHAQPVTGSAGGFVSVKKMILVK